MSFFTFLDDTLINTKITDLDDIPELQQGESVKHHTRTTLSNKLLLTNLAHLPFQFLKNLGKVLRKVGQNIKKANQFPNSKIIHLD